MYKQTLYKVVTPIKLNTIARLNKSKKWEYGYNKENDIVVISKTGMIGEILEIENLRVALPKMPVQVFKHEKNKWVKSEQPKELERLKTIFDAFEILNRIHEEEAMLEGRPMEEEKKNTFKGFAEGRSK